MKATRLAFNWRLADAVAAAERLDCALDEQVAMSVKQLSRWESGDERPRPAALDRLCRLYETRPDRIGFGVDYSPSSEDSSAGSMARSAIGAVQLHDGDGHLLAFANRVRTTADKNLTPSTVSHERIDFYLDTFAWRRREYCSVAPAPMLDTLLAECSEIQSLAAGHHPAAIARRLSELTANYATLIADALMKLGEQSSAHGWYATAAIAADDSGDPLIRAQVRAQSAMLPYYYGHLTEAVRLAREAQLLARGRPCSAAALAAAAEGRALARLGHVEASEGAMRRCQEIFDQLSEPDEELAFRFTERRLLLYLSGTLTYLGATRRATEVQTSALVRYRDDDGIDPVLIRLDQAICLANNGDLDDGCQLAVATLTGMAPQHRTGIVLARTSDLIAVLPATYRSSRAVRSLTETLALPPGS
ncbi:MAG: helix-turn-helix transcriptional regulator [Kribbellaceae bacterium]|nr:helix-turn-helix transcriptional regulator [Kribbellaceae bacterium]